MNEKVSQQQSEIFKSDTLKILTEKAVSANGNHSLNMQPFIETYGMEAVKKDYAEIAEQMAGYMERKLSPGEKMGYIFESAFLEISSKGEWFGSDSEVVHASKYDDIRNGVDMISTIIRPDDSAHHMAIASDLTYSQMGSSEKFNRIVNGIHQGKMAQIKYFHSDLIGFTGRLSNVPRTVVGLDVENLQKLLLNWIKEPELTQMQFGLVMMQQIKAQSKGFASLAKSVHGDGQVYRAYRRTANVIEEIINHNYQGIEAPEDRITETIVKASERLRSS